MAVAILDAAANPISSYNNEFSILVNNDEAESIPTGEFAELSPEEEEAIMQEKWDNGEFDDMLLLLLSRQQTIKKLLRKSLKVLQLELMHRMLLLLLNK